jgi:hypothetical protein
VIGDTNGDGKYDGADSPTAPVSYFSYQGQVWNANTDCARSGGACTNLNGPEQSLPHLVTKFVGDDGELIVEATPRLRTGKEEIRNFMNWFSYYRTREQVAKSGMSIAFAQLVNINDTTKPSASMNGKRIRLGYDTINSGSIKVGFYDAQTNRGPGQNGSSRGGERRGAFPGFRFRQLRPALPEPEVRQELL